MFFFISPLLSISLYIFCFVTLNIRCFSLSFIISFPFIFTLSSPPGGLIISHQCQLILTLLLQVTVAVETPRFALPWQRGLDLYAPSWSHWPGQGSVVLHFISQLKCPIVFNQLSFSSFIRSSIVWAAYSSIQVVSQTGEESTFKKVQSYKLRVCSFKGELHRFLKIQVYWCWGVTTAYVESCPLGAFSLWKVLCSICLSMSSVQVVWYWLYIAGTLNLCASGSDATGRDKTSISAELGMRTGW